MEVKNIEKINLDKGDILLVTMPDDCSDEDMVETEKLLRKLIPYNEVVFKPESISVKAIKPSKKEKP